MNLGICSSVMESPKHCKKRPEFRALPTPGEQVPSARDHTAASCFCTGGQEGRRAEVYSRQDQANKEHYRAELAYVPMEK